MLIETSGLLSVEHILDHSSHELSKCNRPSTSPQGYAVSLLPSLTSFCSAVSFKASHGDLVPLRSTYQRLHRPVQRMPMVPPELGVCAVEGGVAVGFWLLDTAEARASQRSRIDMVEILV
jgi:hypothetical protein